jgi:hypothetical protein
MAGAAIAITVKVSKEYVEALLVRLQLVHYRQELRPQ